MSDLKFTIIVPTRERSDTLKHTIKSVLAQDYSNFTVLVSDNASEDDTAAVVASFNDPRVQYVNTGTRVSMSENWEFALSHVNDGWVTIIGDDDGLIPGCLKKVSDIAKSFNTRAVRSNGCFYTWPSLRNSEYGKLGIRFKPGCEIRRTSSMLQNVLDGKKSYTELPMLYNGGFVCYSLIDEIKKITPRFFRSITPDVYSAMVFSLVAENYVYSYEPLALNGASIHSGGTANFENIEQAYTVLDSCLEKYSDMKVITGGNNRGIDKIATAWAAARRIDVIVHRPDFKKHGSKRAPFMRNDAVVAMKPKGVLVFVNPDDANGVAMNLLQKAEDAGIVGKRIVQEAQ